MSNLTISFEVEQSPQQVFDAVINTRGWWGRGIEGGTVDAGDEFTYRHKDIHYSHHRLTSVVPGKKVEWLTTASQLNFVDHKEEWTGTTIVFEIATNGGGKTTMRFTHVGLTPALECFAGCKGGWDFYVGQSLKELIETGKGRPD